jgi:hypothetical protein
VAKDGEVMSTSILDDPEHWRQRAEESRLIAEQLDDPVARAAMLRIAEDYERIAEQARVGALDRRRSGPRPESRLGVTAARVPRHTPAPAPQAAEH